MIRSFACADTEAVFHRRAVSRSRNIERVVRRKLLQIHVATELASLRVPPGSQLEALKADRKGQHSIRINDHLPALAREIGCEDSIDRDRSRELAIAEAPTVLDRCRSMVNTPLGDPSQNGGECDGRT